MRVPLTAMVSILGLMAGVAQTQAADLEWEVESPFRLYKAATAFALHEKAFTAVRGDPASPIPADIVLRTERRLNDPDCRDNSTPATCAATKRGNYEESRLGWAAKTLSSVCYDSVVRPRRYPSLCDRKYSWGSAKEDLILPEAHTVVIRLAAAVAQGTNGGKCVWTWQPRAAGGKSETRTLPCTDKLTIARVPYSLDRARSGVAVTVKLPDERELTETVIVEDVFVAGIGDSFSSGESNPDRPVSFSATRQMVYDPLNTRDEFAMRTPTENSAAAGMAKPPSFGLASGDLGYDPKTLPKRRLEDEDKGMIFRPTSREFMEAFNKRNAQWVSADCHRSQYGWQFRVALALSLENRHRAVTFVHLACSGAQVTDGLFLELDAREQTDKPNSSKVPPQLDQLSDIICRGGAAARTRTASYALPVFSAGDRSTSVRNVAMRWCPPEQRKRPIDVVLLSIGGNDVGLSGLGLYAMSESAGDLAPIAAWIGSQIRYNTDVTRVYLNVLDQRLKAVKDALRDGFGIAPNQVVQTAYEPLTYDETGALCGLRATLGMDVHPKLRISRERNGEASSFVTEFQARLACTADAKRGNCPGNLATGSSTGFHFVTEHLAKFQKRGMCARDPARAQLDGTMMAMPRISATSGNWEPFSPANTLPYGHRWRLFHTPNDAFLTANVHREGISLFDILQPAYAALFSGAMHPTAEGHAVVADSVLPHVRSVIDAKAR